MEREEGPVQIDLLSVLDLDRDRVKRLRDVSASISQALLRSIEEQEPTRLNKKLGQSPKRIIAATYLRKAAAHSVLMGDIAIARHYFQKAAQCYYDASKPYGLLMDAMNGRSDRSQLGQEHNPPEAVYVILASLGQERGDKEEQASDSLEKIRISLEETSRGTRLGILAFPLEQYLEVYKAVSVILSRARYLNVPLFRNQKQYEGTSREFEEEGLVQIRKALLPFVEAYSSALQRAKRDKFHWERLAMVFHPVEPDVIGILVMAQNALRKEGINLSDLVREFPVSEESLSVLQYCLDHLGIQPDNPMEDEN